tara:strand:+ start:5932 stop:6084 length:153 start_codon:yes stop_codon:yes gene_type:complete
MIQNIIEMLEIVKKQDSKNMGKLTKIAVGKNKIPMSFKESIQQIKFKLWL